VGAYSAPPDLLAEFKGPTFKAREGVGVGGFKWRADSAEGKECEETEEEGTPKGWFTPRCQKS